MTPKQEQFCREYLIDLNATQAAIRAGYSERTAYSQGERLLRNAEVGRAISSMRSDREERTDRSGDEVIRRLWEILEADPRDLFDDEGQLVDPKNIPDQLARLITGIEPGMYGMKIKFMDKNKAIELLGRHYGKFVDRIDHTVQAAGVVQILLPDNQRDATDAS